MESHDRGRDFAIYGLYMHVESYDPLTGTSEANTRSKSRSKAKWIDPPHFSVVLDVGSREEQSVKVKPNLVDFRYQPVVGWC